MPIDSQQQSSPTDKESARPTSTSAPSAAPTISLPKGGGAIRGIGEKFANNPVAGTASMSVPIATTPGRSGFGPQLTLSYDSGSGNGPFGFGWSLALPSITRKTDKGLPKYLDSEDSDVFVLSGSEDLVPALVANGESWRRDSGTRTVDGVDYRIDRYRPRVEGLFALIERWTNKQTGESHWRSISRDNITTVYGKTAESRVVDPENPTRIFSWLICESRDDKGNSILYNYVSENSDNVDLAAANERNRTVKGRSANRYLKRIKYGNVISHLIQPDLSHTDWLFELVFDYGEGHYEDLPPSAGGSQFVNARTSGTQPWPVRQDPFSTYRAGFENRTYRLCRRALMFHHFPQELGTADYLVRSTEFAYKETPVASFITSVTQSGYVRKDNGTYLKKSLPPIEFEYSEAIIKTDVRELDAASLENLPSGLDGAGYQWADLDGEGLSGILTEQANAWFYKRNTGDGHFAATEFVSAKPTIANLAGGQQLMDLAGDGQLDLVEFGSALSGFHERTDDGGWSNFTPFPSLPRVDWHNPNLKFVDLTGDGHADILVAEAEGFTWYPSLAEDGFGPASETRHAVDEEISPRLIFADGTQSVFVADMSGDGLSDVVRIRNGEVCFWPNLGYGRFGAKVTMDHAPWFDAADQFDGHRLRLADIDGSGVTDIIYLKPDAIHLYFNESGNGWSDRRTLDVFPPVDNVSSVTVVDLSGNGTACIVWSSSLPEHALRPLRYVELMEQKPHLLITTKNNMGAETHVQYASSTKFYLADKAAGTPWVTRLPFPVHVVERVETLDRISRNRFVKRYAYHHGYFDGVEREFRGFGMVEEFDTEEFAVLSASDTLADASNIDQASHVPPVLTRTWFHTGAYLERGRISKQFEHEYYREGDPSLGEGALTDEQLEAMLLPDTVLPAGLSVEEEREACRALKGSILRQEIYALDGSEKEDRPYSVSERNYTVNTIQPRDVNQHAVFFTHARETVDFHYERALYDIAGEQRADPRVTHNLVLEVNDFGNVVREAAVGYGRRFDDPDANLTEQDRTRQRKLLITVTENRYTNLLRTVNAYRTPLLFETKTYELIKTSVDTSHPRITNLFRFEELAGKIAAAGDGLHDLSHEDFQGTGAIDDHTYRRLIENVRTVYRSDDLTNVLPPGQLESKALMFESYKLTFTPALIQHVYGDRVVDSMLIEGGYVHSENDSNWWIPSGRVHYSADLADAPAAELDQAQRHFFLPRLFVNPFGHATAVTYDTRDMLLVETRDALDNAVRAENDYRIMQPRLIFDPNANRCEVVFDALGLVVATAVMGKQNEVIGDSLDASVPDLDRPTIDQHQANPLADPHAILQNATTRLVYDFFQYQRTASSASPRPNYICTLSRETHVSDLAAGEKTKIQQTFSYSDGFGREVQKKIEAEPGKLNNAGNVVNRWVASGWTIFNNKGKAVRKYEPFFTGTHEFEFAKTAGVSPIIFYDPLERVVATLQPNHTLEKTVFDPWRQETWDRNDLVLVDPKSDEHLRPYLVRLADGEYLPTWHSQRKDGLFGSTAEERQAEQTAAKLTEVHAATPAISYSDTLGHPFHTIKHNRFERNNAIVDEKYSTRLNTDIENKQLQVIDPLGRTVVHYNYDIVGNQIQQRSTEAGDRWTLNDVAGKTIRSWSSRGIIRRITYDITRRPVDLFVTEGGVERLAEKTIYGESLGTQDNHRTRVHQLLDAAGRLTSEAYDFKGNLLRTRRELLSEYRNAFDWKSAVVPIDEAFVSSTTFNALNRPTSITTPDTSVYRPLFNQSNLLDRIEIKLRGSAETTVFVDQIAYNAKGQREKIVYGNRAETVYEYDPLTFRLTSLTTTRPGDPDNTAAQLFQNPTTVQALRYTYDSSGNITRIADAALKTIFHNNEEVTPTSSYKYDAVYQLIEAAGREHIAQTAFAFEPASGDRRDFPYLGRLADPNDPEAMRNYVERYEYDQVGNFQVCRHLATDSNWNRNYVYEENSLLDPAQKNNRLTRITVNGFEERYRYTDALNHDVGGCITGINNLLLEWNFKDQLQKLDAGGGGRTFYVYDSTGCRSRKVTETQSGARKQETIYIGSFEIYREFNTGNGDVTLARESLHVMDDQKRVAIVETTTTGNNVGAQLARFQFANHLDSASVELDQTARVISFEETHPFGTSSYQTMRNQVEIPRRYRFTGKERDGESGFYYHHHRYYMPWTGRWLSCDPLGLVDGTSLYVYAKNEPTNLVDPKGQQAGPFTPFVRMRQLEQTVNEAVTPVVESAPVQVASGALDAAADGIVGIAQGVRDRAVRTYDEVAANPAYLASGPLGLATASTVAEVRHQATEVQARAAEQGGGVRGWFVAVNQQWNPAYGIFEHGDRAIQAAQRGDWHGVGSEGTKTVGSVVATVALAEGVAAATESVVAESAAAGGGPRPSATPRRASGAGAAEPPPAGTGTGAGGGTPVRTPPRGGGGTGGGPRIRSRYADGTPVYEGQQPPRITGPDPNAAGNPHTVLRTDRVNQRTYQGREFDAAGNPVRDVDFTNPTTPNGTPRPGHPGPPHQHRFDVNNPRVGPRSGFRRGPPEPMP